MSPSLSPPEKLRFEAEIVPQLDVLYRMARSVCRDGDLADDIAQEAFLKALNGFSGLQPGTNSRSWLARIVHNTCRDHWRFRSRQAEESWDGDILAEVETPSDDFVWEPQVIREAFDDEIEMALRELPPRWRAAVLLVDVEGWSYEEAADSLEIAPGSLRSALHRARKLLFRKLKETDSNQRREEGGLAT